MIENSLLVTNSENENLETVMKDNVNKLTALKAINNENTDLWLLDLKALVRVKLMFLVREHIKVPNIGWAKVKKLNFLLRTALDETEFVDDIQKLIEILKMINNLVYQTEHLAFDVAKWFAANKQCNKNLTTDEINSIKLRTTIAKTVMTAANNRIINSHEQHRNELVKIQKCTDNMKM